MQQPQPSASRLSLPSMPILAMSSQPAPGAVPAVGPAPSLTAELRAGLRRGWRLAGALALLVGVLLGALTWVGIAEKYQAEAWLHVPPPAPEERTSDPAGYLNKLELQAQSPTVLAAALTRANAEQEPLVDPQSPLVWLQRSLHVEVGPRDQSLRIRVESRSDSLATRMARAVAGAFLEEALAQRQHTLDELKAAIRQASEQVQAKRLKLDRWEQNTQRRSMEKDLQQARFNLRATQAELAQLEKQPPSLDGVQPTEKALLEYLNSDPTQQQTLRLLAQVDAQIQSVRQVSAPGASDAMLQELGRQRDRIQQELLQHKEAGVPQVRKKLQDEVLSQYHSELRRLHDRIVVWQKLQHDLEGELARQSPEGTEQQRASLRQEVSAETTALQQRQAELKAAELAPAPSWPGENVVVRPLRQQARWIVACSLGLSGALFMLLLVGWVESQQRRVTGSAQVARTLGLRVLGRIPLAAERAGFANLAALGTEGPGPELAPLTEAVDALRTMLLCDGEESPRVILVTSANPGEGKTSLAAWLAVSMARGWRKTLLIDGNLRKPDAHTLLGTPLEPGLSEVLRTEVELAEVIQPTALGRLWVMAAGHGDTHAVQSLAQPNVALLFEQLRQQYDCIVIDGCSVLTVADSLMVSRYADVALLAVRSGVSYLPAVAAAQQMLAGMNVLTPGVVLIGKDNDLHG